jgi:hypothetical protein
VKNRSLVKNKSINIIENEIFQTSLKHIIFKLSSQCPIEILIKLSDYLDILFKEMKEQYNLFYAKKYTVKERNTMWRNIAKKYQIIFQPLLDIINKETDHDLIYTPLPDISEKPDNTMVLNHAIKVYQNTQINRNWPNPFDIDFLKFEPNKEATISCKIRDLEIPYAILDTGSSDTLFTDNIPKYLEEKIDKKNIHKLTGAVGASQSIGAVYNIPITIGTEKDTITVIENEISVIPTQKDRNGKDISILILGTKWQHRVGWDPIVKGEFTATSNGKTITIPISTRNDKKKDN